MSKYVSLLLILFLLAGVMGCFNDELTKSKISGIVLDKGGQPVEEATVTLVGAKENPNFITDSTGTFRFYDVPPGHHMVRVVKKGYPPTTKSINVFKGEMSTLNIVLGQGKDGVSTYDDFMKKKLKGDTEKVKLEDATVFVAYVGPSPFAAKNPNLLKSPTAFTGNFNEDDRWNSEQFYAAVAKYGTNPMDINKSVEEHFTQVYAPLLENPVYGGIDISSMQKESKSILYMAKLYKNNVIVFSRKNFVPAAIIPWPGEPYWVALSKDGVNLYIVDKGQNLTIIDTQKSYSVTASIPVGTGITSDIYLARNNKLYIALTSATDPSIVVLDTSTRGVEKTVSLPRLKGGILPAVTSVVATSSYIFACLSTSTDGEVAVVDINSYRVIKTIPVGAQPTGITATPNGAYVYVANYNEASVSVIDGATLRAITKISVGINPARLAAKPDGTAIYVTNAGSDNVSVIDPRSNTVIATIPVGKRPMGIAVNEAGTQAVVANSGSGNASIINTQTNAVINTTLPVEGARPFGVTIK